MQRILGERLGTASQWGCAVAITLTLVSSSAGAQSDADAAEVGAEGTVEGETPEVVITDQARAHFKAGVNFMQDPDGARYEEAYREFKAAYAQSPSWKILGNLGIAAMKLERDGDAIDAFERYLTESGDSLTASDRAQYERDLQTLKTGVVTLVLEVEQEGVTFVDERQTNRGLSIINRYGPAEGEALEIRVRSGQHQITAKLAGHEPVVWEIDAAAASSHTHRFVLSKPQPKDVGGVAATPEDSAPEMHRPVPTSVWIGVGATGLLTGGAVVTGILATGKKSDYDDANDGSDPDAAESLKGDVETLNLVTDVLIGGAVVAGAVTTILYLTRPEKPVESALQFTPIVGPNLAALSLSGSF